MQWINPTPYLHLSLFTHKPIYKWLMAYSTVNTLISIKLVTHKAWKVRPRRIMDNNEVYAAMILFGLTFEALWVTNFIEMSVYHSKALYNY